MKKHEIIKIFKALSHYNRIKIINMLKENKSSFTNIESNLQLKQSTISHHIKILKEAGLIIEEKEGKNKYYSINKLQIKIIYDYIRSLVK